MKLQSRDHRIKKYLDRDLRAPVYQFDQVCDPRARQGKRHPLRALLLATLLGMLAGCRKLREVEDLTDELGPTGRKYLDRRIADTTLQDLWAHQDLEVDSLRKHLWWQVKVQRRQKRLEPVGLPCGVAAIDGKKIHCLGHDAAGDAQKVSGTGGQPDYYLLRVQRAVLTSAAGKPALDQMVVPPQTNEMGAFAAFFLCLVQAFGDLFEIVTMDAGTTSLANADLVQDADKGYVMALKDNQPKLYGEAQRLLLPLLASPPEAQTGWERHGGRQVKRCLYRIQLPDGIGQWGHLRQIWLVRQYTRQTQVGPVHIEDRYYVTNLRWGRLKPGQILLVVRNHWGIENDCFWSMDAQFGEDDHPWVTKGHALLGLGVMRLMAYNLLQWARKCHLRRPVQGGRFTDPPSWKQLFRWVWQALRLPLDPSPGPVPAG
jgi:hypothetical protein